MLKYVDEAVVCQEVPDEISLALSISNCPYKCPGCHSAYLADDIGEPLLDVLSDKLKYYKDRVTCILFMGGDDEKQRADLLMALQQCRQEGFKTALYTGNNEICEDLIPYLNYVKIGPYDVKRGGLSNPNTNQRMYTIKYKDMRYTIEDITYKFFIK